MGLQWGGENCWRWREYVAFHWLCVGVADWHCFLANNTSDEAAAPTQGLTQNSCVSRLDWESELGHIIPWVRKEYWWWSDANWTEAVWRKFFYSQKGMMIIGMRGGFWLHAEKPEGVGTGSGPPGSESAPLSSSPAGWKLKSDFPEGGGEQRSWKGPVTNWKHRTFMARGPSASVSPPTGWTEDRRASHQWSDSQTGSKLSYLL